MARQNTSLTLRKRVETSRLLAFVIAGLVGGYLWLCQKTTQWHMSGTDQLLADLRDGPVLLIMWHERSLMGPVHWPRENAPLSSLHDRSPIGRASGQMQKNFGLMPIEMSDAHANRAASRAILKRVKAGVSIGMTGDGPLGPVRVVKDAPLEWARVIGCPVYAYAFSTRRHRFLNTWDLMMLPLPFTKGAVAFKKWDMTLARDAGTSQREAAKASLAALMSDVIAQVDARVADDPV
jgi:hypothetical protein